MDTSWDWLQALGSADAPLLNNYMSDQRNDLATMLMGQQHPEQRMDLAEIYKWLQRQQMDQTINNGLFQRAVDENGLRDRENNYLNGPGDWMRMYSNPVPGRRM